MAYAIAFFASLLAGLVITPIVRRKATELGFVDRPDGGRKAHAREVALGGGAAVLAATMLALVFALGAAAADGSISWPMQQADFYWGLLIAALVIGAVGLLDDFVGLPGQLKLIGQIVAAGILIRHGLWIDHITLLGYEFHLNWWGAMALTMCWLLGAINALNLIDGIDGLASSVGTVLCLAVAAITALQGNVAATLIALAMAGSLLGFLRYNFAPASIFLGDAGSMLIGLVIGSIAIHSSLKTAASAVLVIPLSLWAIPMLDSAAAILRRMLTGRSLFAADRGHLHHSLLVRGWSVRQAVLFIGLICLTTCAAAFLSYQFNNELIALATVLCVIIFLIVTKTFGHIEFALIKDRFHGAIASRDSSEAGGRASSIQLQGTHDWNHLWTAIHERAPDFGLVRIQLTINIPSLHEVFYGKWDCPSDQKPAQDATWRVVLPLTVEESTVGRIEVLGAAEENHTVPQVIELVDFLEPLEDDIRQVLSQSLQDEPAAQPAPVASQPQQEPSSAPPAMRPHSVANS